MASFEFCRKYYGGLMVTNNSANIVQNPSNTLTQYTEGTWTPAIAGSTVAGAGTYTVQNGTYTRIGNMVFLSGTVTWTAHTGTGNMLLTGLPITSRNVAGYHYDLNAILSNISLPAGVVEINAELTANTTTLVLEATRNNNTNLPVGMDATGTVDLTGFYLI
jgi:hypothetical protein